MEGGGHERGDPVERVVGGNAVGQLEGCAGEGVVLVSPFGDLDEVIAAGQDATEARDEKVFQAVLEGLALPPRIGDGLGPFHQLTGLLHQEASFRSVKEADDTRCPNSFSMLVFKCNCRARPPRWAARGRANAPLNSWLTDDLQC